MQLSDKQMGEVLVVSPLEERLDAAAAGEFKARMADLLRQGHSKVVINLEGVNFMDSSGLTAIVSTLKTIGQQGGQMAVCGVSDNLQTLFRLTRLDRVFRVFASEQEAYGALTTGPGKAL